MDFSSSMMIVLLAIVSVLSIFSLARRFFKNPGGSLLNPLFLLLAFSLLYFVLPAFYIEYPLLVVQRDVREDAIFRARFYSVLYACCFYIFYLFSKDPQLELTFRPEKASFIIAEFLWWIISLLLVVIIVLYVPKIYAARGDRGLALALYEDLINTRLKLRIILYVHLCVIFVLFARDRSWFWLLPCAFYLIIDYSHGGRTMSFIVLLFSYLMIILKTRKTYFKVAICAVVLLIASGVLQRSDSDLLAWKLYMAGAEFSNTYLTTVFTLDNIAFFHQNPVPYIAVAMSKIIPGGMLDKLMNFGEWYGTELSDKIGMGYGLAGNLITEALVYGGQVWAVLNPFFIGGFLLFINRVKLHRNLWGFFYILLLCITMQNVVRSYFYGFILYPVQIILFPLCWSAMELKKKIFI